MKQVNTRPKQFENVETKHNRNYNLSTSTLDQGLHKKYQWYISTIYIMINIMIFSWENIMIFMIFMIFSACEEYFGFWRRENVLILKYKLDAVDFAERNKWKGCCTDGSRGLLSEVLRY